MHHFERNSDWKQELWMGPMSSTGPVWWMLFTLPPITPLHCRTLHRFKSLKGSGEKLQKGNAKSKVDLWMRLEEKIGQRGKKAQLGCARWQKTWSKRVLLEVRETAHDPGAEHLAFLLLTSFFLCWRDIGAAGSSEYRNMADLVHSLEEVEHLLRKDLIALWCKKEHGANDVFLLLELHLLVGQEKKKRGRIIFRS